jgi:hypothetical protein
LTITSINCTVVRDAITIINTIPLVNETSASDYVVIITGINSTVVLNATSGSYYVLTITSIDDGRVGETRAIIFSLSNDCVFSIAGIYMSFVVDAGKIPSALDRVITITSIESDGAIVDAGTDVALTADSVAAVSSIEEATLSDFDSLVLLAMPVISSLPSAVLNLPELSMPPNFPVAVIMSLPSAVLNVPVLTMPSPPPNDPVAVIMSLPSAVLNVPVLTMPWETYDELAVIVSLPSAVLNVPVL